MNTTQTPRSRNVTVSPVMKIYFFALFNLLFLALGYLASTYWFVALIAYTGCTPFWFHWMCGYPFCRSSSVPRFPFSEARPIRPIRLSPQGPSHGEMEKCARDLEAVLDRSLNSSSDDNPEDSLNALPGVSEKVGDEFPVNSAKPSDCPEAINEESAQEQEAASDGSSIESVGAKFIDSEFQNSGTLELPSRFAKPSDCPEAIDEETVQKQETVVDGSCRGSLAAQFNDSAFQSSGTLSRSAKLSEGSEEIEMCVQSLEACGGSRMDESLNSSSGKLEVPSNDFVLTSSESTEFDNCSTKYADDSKAIEKDIRDLEAVLNGSLNSSIENSVAPLNDVVVPNSGSLVEMPDCSESVEDSQERLGMFGTNDDFDEDKRFNNRESSHHKQPVVDDDSGKELLADCMKECDEYSLDRVPLEFLYIMPIR